MKPIYLLGTVILGTALAVACGSSDKGGTGNGQTDAGNGGGTGTGGAAAGGGGTANGGSGTGASDASAGGDASVNPDAPFDAPITNDGYVPPIPDAALNCKNPGETCAVPDDCCNKICDPLNKCGGSTVPVCTADGASCGSSTECCSKICGTNNTCTAVTAGACGKTLGNPCTQDIECCSKLCGGGVCQQSSFCTQPGDICLNDLDCCSGICNITSGSVGTCALQPTGSANCTGVDGVVCDSCGDCCSRLCAPGPTGKFICQPATGCHVTGDVCQTDKDCCGGDSTSGLPGAGNIQCDKEPGEPVGICNNGQACTPQGNVCHYKNYYCDISSASNSCCSAVGSSGRCLLGTDNVLRCNGFDDSVCVGLNENDRCSLCQLDSLGVPRCNGLGTCRLAGETCSNASDCCNDLPCVFDPVDQRLECGATISGCDGPCTTNADCVAGSTCVTQTGSIQGTCQCPVVTPPDSGAGGTGSGGTPSTGGSCSLYGQTCTTDGDCCSGVPCSGGVCKFGG